MNTLGRSKKIKNYLNSKIVLVVLLFIAIFLISKSMKMFVRTNETKEYLFSVREEYANLEKRYSEITNDLNYLNSKTGEEREIRAKFDLSKDGEKAIFIIEEEQIPSAPSVSKSFLEKLKDLVTF